jgi:hypothetical protein
MRRSLKMPRRIFDFKCSNNHITERYIDTEIRQIDCPDCGELSERIISPVLIGGYLGSEQWARKHEKAALDKS